MNTERIHRRLSTSDVTINDAMYLISRGFQMMSSNAFFMCAVLSYSARSCEACICEYIKFKDLRQIFALDEQLGKLLVEKLGDQTVFTTRHEMNPHPLEMALKANPIEDETDTRFYNKRLSRGILGQTNPGPETIYSKPFTPFEDNERAGKGFTKKTSHLHMLNRITTNDMRGSDEVFRMELRDELVERALQQHLLGSVHEEDNAQSVTYRLPIGPKRKREDDVTLLEPVEEEHHSDSQPVRVRVRPNFYPVNEAVQRVLRRRGWDSVTCEAIGNDRTPDTVDSGEADTFVSSDSDRE